MECLGRQGDVWGPALVIGKLICYNNGAIQQPLSQIGPGVSGCTAGKQDQHTSLSARLNQVSAGARQPLSQTGPGVSGCTAGKQDQHTSLSDRLDQVSAGARQVSKINTPASQPDWTRCQRVHGRGDSRALVSVDLTIKRSQLEFIILGLFEIPANNWASCKTHSRMMRAKQACVRGLLTLCRQDRRMKERRHKRCARCITAHHDCSMSEKKCATSACLAAPCTRDLPQVSLSLDGDFRRPSPCETPRELFPGHRRSENSFGERRVRLALKGAGCNPHTQHTQLKTTRLVKLAIGLGPILKSEVGLWLTPEPPDLINQSCVSHTNAQKCFTWITTCIQHQNLRFKLFQIIPTTRKPWAGLQDGVTVPYLRLSDYLGKHRTPRGSREQVPWVSRKSSHAVKVVTARHTSVTVMTSR
ncbi:hypothetical protein RRG08_035815 [Elysia crispata]|uniref:Uncharacterized protein n=1 Tax=Elysia crispata TaxID=231223 RepID=A0AAE1AK86_9GAST|nr:hypothetical protein RRG08_035815 [Elysia crispata]